MKTLYHGSLLHPDDFRELVAKIARARIKHGLTGHPLAVRGVSGLIAGGAVSISTGANLAIVRKPDEKSHSHHKVEGPSTVNGYVILDDMIESGQTVIDIVEAMTSTYPGSNLMGIIFYNFQSSHCFWRTPEDIQWLRGQTRDAIGALLLGANSRIANKIRKGELSEDQLETLGYSSKDIPSKTIGTDIPCPR